MTRDFSVKWRNPGHWDVYGTRGRLFCIRGQPGDFYIRDERAEAERGPTRDKFTTVDAELGTSDPDGLCAVL
jgi:hypothetical protein